MFELCQLTKATKKINSNGSRYLHEVLFKLDSSKTHLKSIMN